MLTVAKDVLKVDREKRHAYQEAFVSMIGENFVGVRAMLESKQDQRVRSLEDLCTQDGALKACLETSKDLLKTKERHVKDAKTMRNEAEAAEEEALAGVTNAEKARRELNILKPSLLKEHANARTTHAEYFKVLQNNPPPSKSEVNKLFKALSASLVRMGVEESLRDSAPAALLKPPEARGDYDTMVIDSLDRIFVRTIKAKGERLAGYDEEVKAADELIVSTKAAAEEASQNRQRCVEALVTAESQREECKKKIKATEKELTESGKMVSKMRGELEVAEEKVVSFARVEEAFAMLRGQAEEARTLTCSRHKMVAAEQAPEMVQPEKAPAAAEWWGADNMMQVF